MVVDWEVLGVVFLGCEYGELVVVVVVVHC